MSKQWENKNIQTLAEITTYNNLFVEIENAAYAATFIGNPSQYAHPWQIVFLPAYNQIWTQGDFYGTNSYEYEKTIARLQAQDEALGQAIGDIATYSYITPAMLGDGVPQNVTNIENYLYSYISKEIDKLNKDLISSYTSVTHEVYDADNAYVTVSYVHDDETGTAYTVELHNAAANSYVQSAYAYIEQQINDINTDINATSVSITYDDPVEGKAYVTASVIENENFPGVTYNLSLHNVSSYTEMISYVNDRITSLINGAPEALDTLKEIADWISTNPQEGATNLITRVQNLETAYQAADTAIINAYTAADTAIINAYTAADTAIINAYTAADTAIISGYEAADTAIINAYTAADTAIISGYEAADTAIISGYEAADTAIISGYETAIQNLENNSYFNVNFGDGENPTKISHTQTLNITGETVNGVQWTDTISGNQTTGTINDAIEALENRIHTAEGDGIQQISSPNGSITGSKTGTTYTLETDANIIPVTTDDNPEYFSTGDSVETALVGIDAQVHTNTTNIEAILEALNWTIVGGAVSNDNP